MGATLKVRGDNLVLSVAEDPLEGALRYLLHHLLMHHISQLSADGR